MKLTAYALAIALVPIVVRGRVKHQTMEDLEHADEYDPYLTKDVDGHYPYLTKDDEEPNNRALVPAFLFDKPNPSSAESSAPAVTFCEHYGCNSGFKWEQDGPMESVWVGAKNDKISEIVIQKGWKLQIFQHSNFGGRSKVFEAQDSAQAIHLGRHNMNDEISSFKIFKLNPTIDTSNPTSAPTFDEKATAAPTSDEKDFDFVEDLHYGEAIYLQNNGLDHRWLSLGKEIHGTTCFTHTKKSGCVKSSRSCRSMYGSAYKQVKKRDCGVFWEKKFECKREWCELDIVATTDIYNTDDIMDDHFEWIVTQPNSEANENNNGESKTCVKYGDEFSLKSKWEDRLLTGQRTKEFGAEPGPDMMWVARSAPGSGDLDQNKADNADPAFGECISDKSLVFLQNLSKNYQWLSGSRSGGNTKVYLQNIHEINEEAATENYGWIMRKYKGSGSRNDRLQCAAVTAVGRWVKLNSISSDSVDGPPTQTVVYSKGTERSTSHEETNTNEWETSVTAAITAGFNYMAASGSASLEVSASYASTLSSTISTTVAEDSSQVYEATFPGKGQIWQFQYAIEDICNSGASLLSSDLAHTSDGAPPCCLPNQEIDSLHGPCKPGTPCSCSKDICEVRSSGETSLASNSIQSSTGGSNSIQSSTGGGMVALFVALPLVGHLFWLS